MFCPYSPDSGSHDDQSGSHNLQDGSHDSSSEEEETIEVTDDHHDNQWDCESVLSTYSNLYNHPVTISEQVRVWCAVIRIFCYSNKTSVNIVTSGYLQYVMTLYMRTHMHLCYYACVVQQYH